MVNNTAIRTKCTVGVKNHELQIDAQSPHLLIQYLVLAVSKF